MSTTNIEEYFKYHPPTTKGRVEKHDMINSAALEFAKVVEKSVNDEETKRMAFWSIQQARMFANQGCTLDEINLK